MTASGNLGYPRIGIKRELKFALEKYWEHKIPLDELQQTAQAIQKENWQKQHKHKLDYIPSNDFSFYDQVLDTSFMLGAVPQRFRQIDHLAGLDLYFAMARGCQTENRESVPAMEMTKWFNTNYHYIVPEISPDMRFKLDPAKPVEAYQLANSLGIQTRPVILGPVSFLLLAKSPKEVFKPLSKLDELLPLYSSLFRQLEENGVEWIQLDEPFLSTDLGAEQTGAYRQFFDTFTESPTGIKVMLTAYFGDLSVNAELVAEAPFDGLHLDMTTIKEADALLAKLPEDKVISLGLIDGRNIWKSDLTQTLKNIKEINVRYGFRELVIAPSCSMLHVPQDLALETELDKVIFTWLAFADQKLSEIAELKTTANQNFQPTEVFKKNQAAINNRKAYTKISQITHVEIDTNRQNAFSVRRAKQQERLHLPKLPTTTIGSFPQTSAVRKLRANLRKGIIDAADYKDNLKKELEKTIHFQEEIGLDVLVHGEFERNDMVAVFRRTDAGFPLHAGRLGAVIRVALRTPAHHLWECQPAKSHDG